MFNAVAQGQTNDLLEFHTKRKNVCGGAAHLAVKIAVEHHALFMDEGRMLWKSLRIQRKRLGDIHLNSFCLQTADRRRG